MGCTFCATGAMGIVRNLTAGEIVGQVLVLMRDLGPLLGESVFLVFMGMGEPLHNLAHVHRAITVLCNPEGAILSPGRITVSTSGLVSGIERLARMTPRPQLAISLNATTDAARSATMPVNRAWNLARLRQALDAWVLKRARAPALRVRPPRRSRTNGWRTPTAWPTGWGTCATATTSTSSR